MAEILTCEAISNEMLSIEINVVASLYANPELILEHSEIRRIMFKSPMWKCYYTIFEKLIEKGATVIDQIAVETMLGQSGNEKLKQVYDQVGGWNKISIPMDVVETENFSMWVDELKKHSSLYDFIKDCTLTTDHLKSTFGDFDSNDVYDYISAKVNHVFINSSNSGNVKVYNIMDGIEAMIEKANEGIFAGIPYDSPILCNDTAGLCLGNIYLVAAHSGVGKSSYVQYFFLQTYIKNQEPVLIIVNEQSLQDWQRSLLTIIINQELKPKRAFNKARFRFGKFTDEEKELLKQATEILQEKISKGLINICPLEKYTSGAVCKLLRKYAALGVKHFILDTLKKSTDKGNNVQTYESMMDDCVEFDNICKESALNLNLIVTAQLEKSNSSNKRFLNSSAIGMSRNIIDTMAVVLLMRRVWSDEKGAGARNEIKVRKPIKGTQSGVEITLDPSKEYMVMFKEKNRLGSANDYQIVYEVNLGTLQFKEVGITDISVD
ncbi:MAG: DnaB-like helicase C-terminal domain-containing protein [Cellulosilyticaceae bacterium]